MVWFWCSMNGEWFSVVNFCFVSGVVVCLLKDFRENLLIDMKLFEMDLFV